MVQERKQLLRKRKKNGIYNNHSQKEEIKINKVCMEWSTKENRKEEETKNAQRRITGCIRFGPEGPWLPFALVIPLRFISTAHFSTFSQPWSLLRKALFWAAKTSYTAGTLGEMLADLVDN